MAIELKSFQKLAWHYQVLIVLAIGGALLALFWYQFLADMQTEVANKSSQLDQLNQQIAKSLEQKRKFEQFKRETEELQVKLDSLKSILPLERETDQLLRQIQQSAANSSLRILRVSPRQLIDREVYAEWPIDMEVVGTYHNLAAYLDRIRQLPRIVNIGGLRLSSRAPEGEAAMRASVGAIYTATTYVYREESEVTAPTSGARK